VPDVPSGELIELWRWPVKSMAGERQRVLRADDRGVAGDRTHAVLHEHQGEWQPLTAREAPGILAWRAAYPDAPGLAVEPHAPPLAFVSAPDRSRAWEWGETELIEALGDDLGRSVALRRDVRGIHDHGRSVLVTTDASLLALSTELRAPVDVRRFRPNVHVALDAPPWAELGWAGRRLRCAGGVELELRDPCPHGAIAAVDPDTGAAWPALPERLDSAHAGRFGILARVVVPGVLTAGEAVALDAG
jgi:uncharacterized protein YcbX